MENKMQIERWHTYFDDRFQSIEVGEKSKDGVLLADKISKNILKTRSFSNDNRQRAYNCEIPTSDPLYMKLEEVLMTADPQHRTGLEIGIFGKLSKLKWRMMNESEYDHLRHSSENELIVELIKIGREELGY